MSIIINVAGSTVPIVYVPAVTSHKVCTYDKYVAKGASRPGCQIEAIISLHIHYCIPECNSEMRFNKITQFGCMQYLRQHF